MACLQSPWIRWDVLDRVSYSRLLFVRLSVTLVKICWPFVAEPWLLSMWHIWQQLQSILLACAECRKMHISDLTAVFQMNLSQPVPRQFSCCTFCSRVPLGTDGTGFYGQVVLLSPNQQHQSTEGNREHWLQPMAWPRLFFIDHCTVIKGVAAFMLAVQHQYQDVCQTDSCWHCHLINTSCLMSPLAFSSWLQVFGNLLVEFPLL